MCMFQRDIVKRRDKTISTVIDDENLDVYKGSKTLLTAPAQEGSD